MIHKQQFGKRIALLRKKAGYSQAGLAEHLRVTAQAVSKWECGQALPDLDTLVELSWLFNLSINALLEDRGESFPPRTAQRPGVPERVQALLTDGARQPLVASLAPYFTEQELYDLAAQLADGRLTVSLCIAAASRKRGYTKRAGLPVSLLDQAVLDALSPAVADTLYELAAASDPALKRACDFLICPACGGKLTLCAGGGSVSCANGHVHPVDDGVVYFGSREIPGELWSLYLRNYEQYLQGVTAPIWPAYTRGKVLCQELMWRAIERQRPRVLLDVACGTGNGFRYMLPRIHWNCLVILTDLSHRVLGWNRRYVTENLRNPYVDLVYLACDCAHIPIADGAVDCVTSLGGFESMQTKWTDGFAEGFRILRSGGRAVYDLSLVSSHADPNVQKWRRLFDPIRAEPGHFPVMDLEEWRQICRDAGYGRTEAEQVYGELPAPDGDAFPFENQVLQWMSDYVCVSCKH